MVKARLLLFAVVAALLACLYPIHQILVNPAHGHWPLWTSFVGAGLLFLEVGGLPAALAMLICSFFRVNVAPDGRLIYDPQNPYWRLMRKLWKEDWKDQISLCSAFWKTWFFFFGSIVISFLVYMLGVIIWKEGFNGLLVGMAKVAGPIFAVVGGIFAFAYIITWLTKRGGWTRKVGNILTAAFAILTCTIFPICLLMYGNDPRPFSAALWAYLSFIGVVVAGLGAFAGVCYLVSKTPNTLLGQFLLALKNKLCPFLYAKTPEVQT